MSDSLLDYICAENAKRGRYLYQADKGGRIMINWEQVEGHEHATHNNSDTHVSDAVKNTHLDADERGGHEHNDHAQTNEAKHLHEKGEHSTEHSQNHPHPASA